jgi:DNA topoisomerase I
MATNLVIVESPSKCSSIKSYLGDDWTVMASYGHVRRLIPKKNSVDPDNNFEMKFEIIKNKFKGKDPINAILKAAEKADIIWLASDPDREGEAIAYHVQNILRENGITKPVNRITFNEISKTAVQTAVKNPRNINMSLVEAQKARQALDFLVGFNLSPLLWSKVCSETSAGRVQSPALRLIDDRETEIKTFNPEEYWSIDLLTHADNISFKAKLIKYDDVSIKQYDIASEAKANEIKNALIGKPVNVTSIVKKKTHRKPPTPFTTSTLQQEAFRKLGYSSSRTMKIAQSLYETTVNGKGLITYMRTDSVALADDAIKAIRGFITDNLSSDYLPKEAVIYKSKSKNAQEAHEAIRPVDVSLTPVKLENQGYKQEFINLYKLIWYRTVASQMTNAIFDNTSVEITVDKGVFRTNGNVLVFDGFKAIYTDSRFVNRLEFDDSTGNEDKSDENKSLPNLSVGQVLPNDDILTEQHFTKPPPRFNEASLVKTLEEYGIGRPSTYATIISTLENRKYVTIEQRRFSSSDKGHLVNEYLKKHFSQYVDYDFTAAMEDKLDEIANGNLDRKSVLADFWKAFNFAVQTQKASGNNGRGVIEKLDETCPECNEHKLVIKLSKYGRFIACENYPKCKYFSTPNRDSDMDTEQKYKPEVLDKQCPECGKNLVKRMSKNGREFVGCTGYPSCTYIEGRVAPKDTGRQCPQCKRNNLVERKTKFGNMIACGGYPRCKYIDKSQSKKTTNNKTRSKTSNEDGLPY